MRFVKTHQKRSLDSLEEMDLDDVYEAVKPTAPTASWLHAENGPDGYLKVTVLFPTSWSPLTEVAPVGVMLEVVNKSAKSNKLRGHEIHEFLRPIFT
ncbi:hypothetical protein ROLI_022240 [Roseobacter fucihabitans]|uniref:Uncharacterized protein n=1 Tax=Roseobacter fucihabitans TaxID=1537242 RepID=A0ABZ2BVE4_9RHOB|nr:hypothetical protein [Roseobacter litoralis]